MAYRTFKAWPEIEALALYGAAHADNTTLFSLLEYRVIGLGARADVRRERNSDSRLGRWLNRLFGIRLAQPLADMRLEALRRFASLISHSPRGVTCDETKEFLAAGFSHRQADWLINMPQRTRTPLRATLA
ncbi:hypothetical protein ACMT1E_11885 [Sphingomonas flavalba]|uniref:hypothetical protein n=1 Tax=Sphingomonas flavalba TaxID=2559804 RepID=UPI0039DFB54B